MQPFAQAGLVNLPKLAEYVLGTGFGVKNPEAFLTTAPPPAMEAQGGVPMGGPTPEQGPPPPVPPEIMAQMMQQGGQAPQLPAGIQGPAPQVPIGPQEQTGIPEELLLIIQGLENGDILPEQLPPGIMEQIMAVLQSGQ